MDNITSHRETRDLMSVESFSQLPFIRPSSSKEKPSSSAGAIRLFGKDFTTNEVNENTTTIVQDNIGEFSTNINNNNTDSTTTTTTTTTNNNNNNSVDIITSSSSNSRKFECHYCCRNFPTSQALGGHQNAHKRERQLAKRAHLHPPMVHDYGFTAYNRLPIDYQYHHSWNSSPYTRQLYGYNGNSVGQQQPVVNSTWRVPQAHGSSNFERGSILTKHSQVINNHTLLSFDSIGGPDHGVGLGSRGQPLGFESKGSMKDNVSLDLHL